MRSCHTLRPRWTLDLVSDSAGLQLTALLYPSSRPTPLQASRGSIWAQCQLDTTRSSLLKMLEAVMRRLTSPPRSTAAASLASPTLRARRVHPAPLPKVAPPVPRAERLRTRTSAAKPARRSRVSAPQDGTVLHGILWHGAAQQGQLGHRVCPACTPHLHCLHVCCTANLPRRHWLHRVQAQR